MMEHIYKKKKNFYRWGSSSKLIQQNKAFKIQAGVLSGNDEEAHVIVGRPNHRSFCLRNILQRSVGNGKPETLEVVGKNTVPRTWLDYQDCVDFMCM